MTEKIKNVKDDAYVIKSNKIIESRYKLTTNQQKIVLFLISQIGMEDDVTKLFRVKVSELADYLQIYTKDIYGRIRKIIKDLKKKSLIITHDDGELIVDWVASAEYFSNEGVIELEISRKLRPYLLQLRERFTKYQLKYVIRFRSSYSFRLYELLKQFENLGERRYSLEDFKKVLMLDEDKYRLYADIKRRVIKKAQEEILKFTDLSFDFYEIKEGRKVTHIVFRINPASKFLPFSDDENPPSPGAIKSMNDQVNFSDQEVVEKLVFLGVHRTIADKLLDQYDIYRIVSNIEHFEKVKTYKKDLINPAGWLLKAIEKNFAAKSPEEIEKIKSEKISKMEDEAYALYLKKHKQYHSLLFVFAIDRFQDLSVDEQNDIIENISTPLNLAYIKNLYQKKGLDSLRDDGKFRFYINQHEKLIKGFEGFEAFLENQGYKIAGDEKKPMVFAKNKKKS